ncbi:MAG: iron hydrogenase small subunit [Fibrobacteres bacterium]|nr:iron hydrogenase small subunit [Fibrobacterota bacterium]
MINAKINDIFVQVVEGTTIMEAARQVQIRIPTLCKHPDLPATAACGICVVRVKGTPKMLRACCTPIEENMDIVTHDPEIVSIRRTVLELILAAHPNDCLKCGRNGTCELQKMAADFGIREERFTKHLQEVPRDDSTNAVVLEPEKCIKCGRCVEVCQDTQDVWALSFLHRGFDTRMAPAGDIKLSESPCVKCGQCSAHCPTGAIFEQDEVASVWKVLQDPDKIPVAQIAPAVRVALGEAFGYEAGQIVTEKIYALLRRLGFKAVFDTNFAADVTIMEEASEFVERLTKGKGSIPLITSCCPAWVDFMEKFHSDMIDHFSSCKSPHEILGVLAKTYYAQKMKVDPSKMVMVSVMPCTAKKYEITRTNEMFASGYQDVDIVLTTRELARMIKQAGIDFTQLPDEAPDSVLGDYSGAGTVFGATGGVMEAALRTASYFVTGKQPKDVNFVATRGLDGVKEFEVDVAGNKLRIAVAHGLANVEQVIEKIRKSKAEGKEPAYHFVEVMACPGGCVGGGGQPYGVTDEFRLKRAEGIYVDDKKQEFRCSHENPHVKALYGEFLGKPLSHKSHELLHTKYQAVPMYRR